MERLYLDYNIYDDLAKDEKIISNEIRSLGKIYLSVAHLEEYYNACKSDINGEHSEYLKKMRSLFDKYRAHGSILNPTFKRIENRKESIDDCLVRIKKYDTEEFVKDDALHMKKVHDQAYSKLRELDKNAINNSNLSYKEIWERDECRGELRKFCEELDKYNKECSSRLEPIYGLAIAKKISERQFIDKFNLKKDYFRYMEKRQFKVIEFVVEFLQNILNDCGYYRDKDVRKVKSGIYDTEHIIYSTYCTKFVTEDSGLRNRVNAIYYYLGLETRAISFQELVELSNKEMNR